MREGWNERRLGDLVELSNERLDARPEPVIFTCTEKQKLVDQLERFSKRLATDDTSNYKFVRPGDVVINPYLLWTGAVAQNIGKAAGITSPVYIVLRPSGAAQDQFLGLVVTSPSMRAAYNGISIGSIQRRRRVVVDALLELPIAVPPLAEQRRIVDLIGVVDGALSAASRLVDAGNAVYAALLERMIFGTDAPVRTVKSLAVPKGLVGGPFGSSLVATDYEDRGVPVIRGANLSGPSRFLQGNFVFVSPQKAQALSRNQAQAGDVVFTQRGTLGQVALVPADGFEHYVISQSQMRLRPDTSVVSAEYVHAAFSTARMRRAIFNRAVTTANPHINLGILGDLEIPVPNTFRQRLIVDTVVSSHSLVANAMDEVARLQLLRASVLCDLLSGGHQIPATYDRSLDAA